MELRAIWRSYNDGTARVDALRGIDLTVAQGEFLSIMGPSGSGKSTLLNILGCLDHPTSGTYVLAGRRVDGLSDVQLAAVRNQFVGFIFQDFHLIPDLDALANVALPLIYRGVPRQRVMTVLLGGIAAISLLVGGLGIMNIMLVAVTERTAEIGLRRALGATQVDLVTQFLIEALYLSGAGAAAGIVAGIWGSQVFSQYGFETAVSLQAVRTATIVALGSGLLFGVYPAVSASSLAPATALRR